MSCNSADVEFVSNFGDGVHVVPCTFQGTFISSDGYDGIFETPFDFEQIFDVKRLAVTLPCDGLLPFLGSLCMLLSFFLLHQMMKRRERFELEKPLICWNLLLAAFSAFGALRVIPETFRLLSAKDGAYRCVCDAEHLNSPAFLFWGYLFIWSKLAEFGDTVFIVLRKRPITFLHVYHHSSVLLFCTFAGQAMLPMGRLLVCINLTIHSIMYTYFAIQVGRWIKIPKSFSMTLTTMQVVQMAVMLAAGVRGLGAKWTGEKCDVSYFNLYLTTGLAFTYFVLFSRFFLYAYIWKKVDKIKENSYDSSTLTTNMVRY